MTPPDPQPGTGLPPFLANYFWNCEFSNLRWDDHRDFIIRRILNDGDWEALSWLRDIFGDSSIREWLVAHRGRGIERRHLRFWEAVLPIEHDLVNEWLDAPERQIWDRRNDP